MAANGMHSVLIVEDERIVARDLQETLRGLGYDAFATAASADEALKRATERCPDVVLMDIRIKGAQDGIQTAELLRQRFDIPVVYLTAHADEATIERAKQTEPYGYLLKPIKSAELRSAIEVSVYRHAMEKRLRARERWFSTTLRSIADAVVAVDLAGNVTFMNSAAEKLTGSKAEDAVGKPSRDIIQLVDEQGLRSEEAPLAEALHSSGAVELWERGLLNASTGLQRLISDSASPVIDGNKTLGAVMVFRDVTEHKSLQKQLELSDRLASLGTMAAGVAHEINNPLAIVVANASFVLAEVKQLQNGLAGGDAEQGKRLDEVMKAQVDIESAANRIAKIVADLDAFSRPAEHSSQPTDVSRAIDWAVRATAHELRHRAHVVTNVQPDLRVQADETRLGQVLVNLLINAAHAITPGSADRNEICIAARAAEHSRVVIEVSDTGAGMPLAVAKRIFEPFFTTKGVGAGTGLGLSIRQGIVASFGGEIQVESIVGKGTTFRVVLRAESAHPSALVVSDPGVAASVRGRILVIDDEDSMLRLVARILCDHEVVCVQSARAGLELIEQGEEFDVILSDVMMPTMTGIELYEVLLSRDPELARRVVFFSGGALTDKSEDFFRTVSNRRMEKPFKAATLIETIRQSVAASRRNDKAGQG